MGELDLLVKETLERQVPLRRDVRPDWADVLRRAELVNVVAKGRPRPRLERPRRASRRLLLACALIALAAFAAGASPIGPALAGLGRDAFDGLSSWLRAEPGEPAPAGEQAGFSARNDASYASFPSATKLRLLLRETVGGKTLSLLGFRNGSALCLRLVRADLPAGRGENQCVTLRELRRYPAPALVAAQARFRFHQPATTAEGVFGFADDTLRTVEVRRTGSGWESVRVSSNVFLAMNARPSSGGKPPPFDPIVQVRAVTRDGGRVRVPFVANDWGDYGQGLPNVPSYVKVPSIGPEDPPGPKAVEVRFSGGTIAWLERREPRGEPFALDRRLVETIGPIVISRKIQPDPESPFRVVATLVRVAADSSMGRVRPGDFVICMGELRPLGRAVGGFVCPGPGPNGPFRAGQPFTLPFLGPEPISQLAGLAADEVAAIDLYLASGRIVPAALRDNAYLVQAPTTQLPGKLVAYDDRHHVIGIVPLPGPARPVPCPPARFAPASQTQTPKSYERLDLATMEVNGQEIFGRSVAEVERALGRPDRVGDFTRARNGIREPTLFYGGTQAENAALQVAFRYRKGSLRAISLTYQGQGLVDARLGRVLRMQPLELQRRIAAAYGDRYELGHAYGSQPGSGCTGSFQTARRNVWVNFGLNLYGSGSRRPYLILYHGY